MTRRGRENLFISVAVAALGAWWLTRSRGGAGGHKVGQDLSSYFRRSFGLPPVRIEIAPWRRRYYPAAEGPGSRVPMYPRSYGPTYPQSYQPYQTQLAYQPYQTQQPYQPYQTQPYQAQPYQPPPVTYTPSPMPTAPRALAPAPRAPFGGGTGRPNFAERWRVSRAQQSLNALYGNLLEEDGVMGPKTVDVIQMFQKERGLPTTGVVDDRTQAALESAGSQPAPSGDDWWSWAAHPSEAAS
ncbi:MAG TPA: peptidoglycan-binding domain-containing protein [Thermoanaerobaculia bacterium]|jgi:hypothetical protein|nr:peptidoglycan-binding domain-containing protein [Thermoanaerobaculia bacterium]